MLKAGDITAFAYVNGSSAAAMIFALVIDQRNGVSAHPVTPQSFAAHRGSPKGSQRNNCLMPKLRGQLLRGQ
jgi:hypothetical protein